LPESAPQVKKSEALTFIIAFCPGHTAELSEGVSYTTNRGYRIRFYEPLAAHIVDDLVQRYPLPG